MIGKNIFLRAISIGISPSLPEEKKLAIRVAILDAYWSLLTVSFYFNYSIANNIYPLYYFHAGTFLMIGLGLALFYRGLYEIARPLVFVSCLFDIFITADAVGVNSGYEFYYFTSIALPFIMYTFEEQWKGHILTTLACLVLLTQQIIGTGHFIEKPLLVPQEDKLVAIIFVISYVLIVFTFARRQLRRTHQQIKKQQDELVRSSNMIALGEMAGGIAHEINNPLQAISLQMRVIKEKIEHPEINEHYLKIENLISKMGKMVQGLKDLSRDDLEIRTRL